MVSQGQSTEFWGTKYMEAQAAGQGLNMWTGDPGPQKTGMGLRESLRGPTAMGQHVSAGAQPLGS